MDMRFTKEAYDDIIRTVGTLKSETGGILLGSRDDYIVKKFVFDSSGSGYAGGYDPDVKFLNKVIKEEWENNELALLGFVHSHPRGVSKLSGDWGGNTGDIGYIKAIFSAIPALNKFLVPILYSTNDGGKLEIFPYMAERGREENYKKLNLVVLGENSKSKDSENAEKKTIDLPQQQHNARSRPGFSTERLSGSVDTVLISRSHVVVVGVGGAYGICEDLVRTGIGKLTIIDFDVVSDTNLATQGYYIDDIGKPKVDALSNTLKRINPSIKVTPINKNFLEMPEEEVADIINDASLILMMTDDFHAQKRGNLFSLKYKIPAIFAIMYEKARGAEITFNIPGITPACHRCAVSPRYKQYDMGYQNIITSQGSNSFQTHYLNSVIGMIALSILHRNSEGVEFSQWYGERWERNLVQLRINPNYENRLFKEINNPRAFNFDSVWQKIEEEKPPKYSYTCPDCGGHGDLLKTAINQPI